MTETSTTAQIAVPARGNFVATLRLTTASLAAQSDLTVDDIEDLRLAVDEACALLLPLARPDAALTVDFTMAAGYLAADVSVEVEEQVAAAAAADGVAAVDRDGYAWTVLNALAGPVRAVAEDSRITVCLARRRAVSSA